MVDFKGREEDIMAVLEPYRKKTIFYRNISALPLCLAIAVCVIFKDPLNELIANNAFIEPLGRLAFVGLIALSFFLFVRYACNSRLYVAEYKKSIVNVVLRTHFGDFKYFPEDGFKEEDLRENQLLYRSWNSFRSEDLIMSTYKGVGFRQSDISVSYTTGSSKNRKTVSLMRGRLAEFDFPTDVYGEVVITQKGYNYAYVKGMSKISMENVEFNNKFDVYARDEHSAFYLITPQFMEYIQRLSGYGEIYLKFNGKKVFVLRHGIEGAFEIKESKKINVQAEVSRAYNDIKEILDIIDILNIDDRVDIASNSSSTSEFRLKM